MDMEKMKKKGMSGHNTHDDDMPTDMPPDAGISQEEAEAQLEQDNMEGQAERVDDLSQAIPPADEPLAADRLNTLADTIQNAAKALSGGQIEALPIERVSQPQDAIPPDIFAGLMAFAGWADSQGLADYAIDPEAAVRTNAGLAEAAGTISEMSQDPDVMQATQNPAKKAPTPEPEEEAPPDASRFVSP